MPNGATVPERSSFPDLFDRPLLAAFLISRT